MSTAADLVQILKNRYLLSGANEQRNRLSANYTVGQTTLALQYDLQGIQAGSTLNVGLNTFYVWEVQSAAKTATVSGGMKGATDVSANAGDIVTVAPAWSDYEMFTALNEELASLSSPMVGLFQMAQTEFTYNPSRVGYDLPGITDITDIYEVRYTEPNQYLRTPRLNTGDFRLERGYLSSENSSTFSLKLLRGAPPGQTITVLYRAPFTPFNNLSSTLDSTGLPDTATDLPPLGAALRLGVGREVRRNQLSSQTDTRRADEVPAGAAAASWRGIAALRQQRISEEVARLTAAYPARVA